MSEQVVKKAPLPWLLAGLLLGLLQVAAVYFKEPLGVSTQFVVADAMVLHQAAPEYAGQHPLIGNARYKSFGYGWWLDVGLIGGAVLAALVSMRWRPRVTTVWWRANHGNTPGKRFLFAFLGGFLILLGARLANGCTSGQFASGWAQLSLSVLPFTVTMFGFGMITAWLVYPKAPAIER